MGKSGAVSFANATMDWSVGDGGKILKTTDFQKQY
jgi:hypothetical protein